MSAARVVGMISLAVAVEGCGRLGFEPSDGVCVLEPLDDSFTTEISAWNSAAREDRLTAVVAYDASCAADVAGVRAQLTTAPPRGTVTEVELDWSGALGSFFFSTNASSYGPMLATQLDRYLGAAGTATAHQRVDRVSSDDRDYRLTVFSQRNGLAVVLDGNHHDD